MKLAYREFGAGRPLIILHGLFGQSDNWNTLAKNFAEAGFRVFTIDQRNHGLSPHSEEWTYEAMADDLNEFIEEHALQAPILLGHSMGGKTVLFFEKKYPGIASQLIIADMSAREYPAHHQSVLDALHAVDFNTVENRKHAEEVMNTYISDFGTKQFLLKNIYWKEGDRKRMDWRFNLRVISRDYENVREAVPFYNSSTPTLIIRGETSNYVTEQDVADYENRFPDLSLVTIPAAGHWVHAEKPQEFQKAVLDFITV
jgi:pimeloyl-ACP methyl ester carboxylesterase